MKRYFLAIKGIQKEIEIKADRFIESQEGFYFYTTFYRSGEGQVAKYRSGHIIGFRVEEADE